ncbi:MAG: hypothetical protein FWB78_08050 [Treponema sp.]|nr:hypothetical protein [Treponema sp.]
MKKLIAVPVMLALVAFGAFAQEVSVGGGVVAHTNLIQGDNNDDSEITTSGTTQILRLEVSAEMDTIVGTFGAWLRVQPSLATWGPTYAPEAERRLIFSSNTWGHLWWAPNDMFRLTLGEHPGAWWSRDGIARWGFYSMVQDVLGPGFMWNMNWGAFHGTGTHDYGLSFFPGFAGGLLMELTPNEMVQVRVGLPVLDGGETSDVFANLVGQLGLNLDFGTIALTYRGHAGDGNNGSIFAYLHLGMIEGLGIDFGIGAHLHEEDPEIGIGLAVNAVINPEFGIRARLQADIDTAEGAPLDMLFELLPSFNVAPGVTAFLGTGLSLRSPDVGNASIGFYVFPYVRLGSLWGPSLYAGFELRSVSLDGGDAAINWRVPLGLHFFF